MSFYCPICLEIVTDAVASPNCCEHLFCLPCLQKWSKHGSFCPVDRKRFKKIIDFQSKTMIQIKPRKKRKKCDLYDVTTCCEVCKKLLSDDTLLLCDCCDLAYHCNCLRPPIKDIPAGQWFCPECIAIDSKIERSKSGKNYAHVKEIPVILPSLSVTFERSNSDVDGLKQQNNISDEKFTSPYQVNANCDPSFNKLSPKKSQKGHHILQSNDYSPTDEFKNVNQEETQVSLSYKVDTKSDCLGQKKNYELKELDQSSRNAKKLNINLKEDNFATVTSKNIVSSNAELENKKHISSYTDENLKYPNLQSTGNQNDEYVKCVKNNNFSVFEKSETIDFSSQKIKNANYFSFNKSSYTLPKINLQNSATCSKATANHLVYCESYENPLNQYELRKAHYALTAKMKLSAELKQIERKKWSNFYTHHLKKKNPCAIPKTKSSLSSSMYCLMKLTDLI